MTVIFTLIFTTTIIPPITVNAEVLALDDTPMIELFDFGTVEFHEQSGYQDIFIRADMWNIPSGTLINWSVVEPEEGMNWFVGFHQSQSTVETLGWSGLISRNWLMVDINHISIGQEVAVTVRAEVADNPFIYDEMTIAVRVVPFLDVCVIGFEQFEHFWSHDGQGSIYYERTPNARPISVRFNPNSGDFSINKAEVNWRTLENFLNWSVRGGDGMIILSEPDENFVYQRLEIIHTRIFVVDRADTENGVIHSAIAQIWAGNDVIWFERSTVLDADGNDFSIESIKSNDVWEVLWYCPLTSCGGFGGRWGTPCDSCIYHIYPLTQSFTGRVESWWERERENFLIDGEWFEAANRHYSSYGFWDSNTVMTVYLDRFGRIAARFFELNVPVDVISLTIRLAEGGVIAGYSPFVFVDRNKPRVLVSSLFCAEGILKEVRIGTTSPFPDSDNYITLSTRHDNIVEGDWVRAMLWESLDCMATVSVRDTKNL